MYLARANDNASKISVFKLDDYMYLTEKGKYSIPKRLQSGWRYGKKYRARVGDAAFQPGFSAIREKAADAIAAVNKLRSDFL